MTPNPIQGRIVWRQIAEFFPGYFALVMATGIVSLALHYRGRTRLALALFVLNLVFYLSLWGITLARAIWFSERLFRDLTQRSRASAFLTKAAGTCVLGAQFASLLQEPRVAAALWLFGAGLTGLLVYVFLAAMIICEPKPALEAGISGSWLLVVVAIESVSALGTLVAGTFAASESLLLISLAAFLAGGMLYGFFATLILYRWMFFSLRPERFTPDYWIDMGGLAITALAGALLAQAAPRSVLIETVRPFLLGLTIGFWAAATWWIPLLAVAEIWRGLRCRESFCYSPDYWSLVFPLGMYAVASHLVAEVTGLGFPGGIGEIFTWIALVVWAIIFLGMLQRMARLLSQAFRSSPTSPPFRPEPPA